MVRDQLNCILFLPLLLIIFFSSLGLTQTKLTQDDFEDQLTSAATEGRYDSLLTLVQSHRLFVKPFVDKTITASIEMELRGEKQKAIELSPKRKSNGKKVRGMRDFWFLDCL